MTFRLIQGDIGEPNGEAQFEIFRAAKNLAQKVLLLPSSNGGSQREPVFSEYARKTNQGLIVEVCNNVLVRIHTPWGAITFLDGPVVQEDSSISQELREAFGLQKEDLFQPVAISWNGDVTSFYAVEQSMDGTTLPIPRWTEEPRWTEDKKSIVEFLKKWNELEKKYIQE